MIISKTGFLQVNLHLSNADVGELAQIQEGWCLSLYLPLHHSGSESMQGQVRLRELDARARKQLALRSVSPKHIETILAPVERLLEAADFRHLHGAGLAILSSTLGSACFLLPESPDAMVEVDRRFRLDPLIPVLLEEETFYVLALDLHGVRLYEGDGGSLRPVALTGLHLHAPSTPILDRHAGEDYCREIDRAIQSRLGNKSKPLVLAGNYPLIALYQDVNTYPHLVEEPVVCDPGAEGAGITLHHIAQSRLKAAQARLLDQALGEYRSNLATARTASGITDIVPCSRAGSIEHLFIRKEYVPWGTYDSETEKVATTPVPDAQSVNLANLAILNTLINNGRVHLISNEDMPEGADIAALCRY